MKKMIRKVKEYAILYRDDKTGIAWIQDGSSGCGFSVHANIDASGSVRGMKEKGYWRKKARTVRSHGFIYNIDTFVCDMDNEFERIVSEECCCAACLERRNRDSNSFKVFCEKSLSNDLIGITDDIIRGKPKLVKPAYKFLMENPELMDKVVDRFTIVDDKSQYRPVIYVTFKE